MNYQASKSYLIFKRIIDILGATFGLLLLTPIFIVVALLIKIENPKGPVVFSQIRVGEKKKEFKMYKFRSMVVDAEEKLQELLRYNQVTGAMFKMENDPRITTVGKFIRKTSIDELPQLINVLKGDMSLVGPRPPLVREVTEYNTNDLKRLLVKPGCTGLWQVSGRSKLGFKEMVDLDLAYIENRSIRLDILIIIKTLKLLLGSKDAY
ncbi:sugar transferase [Bacillus haimaensis]|uniref:sugar transferase n=1 Tax=Bacillus haimaensis TaxID=3160967 RepID=UPI003AA8AC7E